MTNYLPQIHADGNEQAIALLLADLFKIHEQRLYMLALGITKSEQQARDIIQEVFLKCWEQRSTLRDIRNLEAWLYRLTENKAIDFLRKAAADHRLRDTIWKNLSQARSETEEWMEAREYNRLVQQAIEQLPPQRRQIYHLHNKEGMSHAEIASELSISRHTVKNQLYTALQSIRRFVARNTRCLFSFL